MNVPIEHKFDLDIPQSLLISTLFEQSLSEQPEATAILFEGKKISYSELNRKANDLANQILSISKGASIVGISTTRSIEMIIGVLGILKSGKAYMPLDLKYPKERLQQMIDDSGAEICLAAPGDFPVFNQLRLSIELINIQNAEGSDKKPKIIDQTSLGYVLFTSGSTGKPKGVSMGQLPLVNLLIWQRKKSVAGKYTRTLQFAPLSFDVSFQEIFATLTTGGTLVLIDDDLRMDPQNLLRFIEEQSISRIFLPFVALQYLSEAADANKLFPASLREVMTAGEQLKVTEQLKRFFSAVPDCVLYNQYGPTECHVVTELKLSGDTSKWPSLPSIGIPIDNTEILVIDEMENLLPDGESGELCISGFSLAEGYLNRPELTKEKFVVWKHPKKGDVRIYKTGDLARFLPDGNIELLGRRDEQVKIRGYRVEPGEIEVLLNRQSGIQQAVVVAREDVPGQKRLVAYLVSSDGKKNTSALRVALDKELPDYMLPSAFVWLDQLPKTTSGKVDRKLLPKPEIKRPELNVLYRSPVTKVEKALAEIWAALLQLDKVGIDDNFFELGGNSLIALKTVATLKQGYHLNLPITKLYQNPTINEISLFLEGKTKKGNFRRENIKSSGGDIAIIAMAGRFPGADTIEKLWSNLLEGKETITFFSEQELDTYIPDDLKNNPDYVKARGIIDSATFFDAAFFDINPRLAELMDPQQRIFLEIAWEALEKSGYTPSLTKGSIGVFAGTGNNTYYLNNVQSNKQKIERVGSFQVMTVNEKDYVASRTAYELDLKGPAVSIHTACSTSLLAIAEAVESIRKGQCDIALAGGSAITSPINSGHVYQEGAMFSRDGHCRTFDADAEGTVFSDGAGVVLLKRLEDAQRDGDTIFSVIKGIGINNDGGGKGSFTAPSAEGQAGAIDMAIQDAVIDPSTIGYIEAHGTATPLGDPIEIEGLNLAFGVQEKKQYCAIGSIKSNIGHLTAAAGVAGLIKTSLALYHKILPASINFKKANPHIDFENSPFYVNNSTRKWISENKRRAGVSSFGVGGTNVHVILEENLSPIQYEESDSQITRDVHLINWSAKSKSSSEAYGLKLSDYLDQNPEIGLADISYTLNSRRENFKFRNFIVASDRNDLSNELKNLKSIAGNLKQLDEKKSDIVFVFPGQGSQHLDMAKGLYEKEPVFKKAVDECAEQLMPFMQEDIRDIIFPAEKNAEAEARIHNTYYTQPALFVIEYATAKLWMSWGIRPAAFVGHSIGEFVAAHLAGVFNLSDGLKLIYSRGRLMSSLEKGSMLGVRAGFEKICNLIPEDISLAAINSPLLSVVSGPKESVKAFSETLSNQGIANKLLKTSHAFHSSMMDPILPEFEKIAASIHMQLPKIPIASTLTGKWMKDTEVTDSAYWVNQLRFPVRFADAIKTVSDEGFALILETGPGRVLSTLTRQQGIEKPLVAINSLDTESEISDLHMMIKALGQLWLNGADPDWNAFYGKQKRKNLQLPAYAFDKIRLWVDPIPFAPLQLAKSEGKSGLKGMNGNDTVTANHASGNSLLPQITVMRKPALIKRLREILEDASGIEMEVVAPDMNFIEVGFDSLLLTQVALNLKKEFGLPISFRQLNEVYGNMDLLATYLDENLPKDKFNGQPIGQIPNLQSPSSEYPKNTAEDSSAIGLITRQIEMLAKQVASLQQNGQQSQPVTRINPVSEISAEELTELKKPFGATAKIERQATTLTDKQQAYLTELTRKYNDKTKGSKKFTQENRSFMADPRVVTGFKPLTKEIVYPIVVNKSKGSRLWDIDGNEYIDALNGFGSNFLGYQPEIITKALINQIESGYELGPQHELAAEVCKLICEFTKFDRAALCNTGSEAVLGAMRIARTVTGRSTIVAFNGSYHGIVDEVIVRGTKKLKSFPAAPGIMPEAVQNMLILDYGTPESLTIIKERANEFAAILVEPVQSRRPEFQPIEFLKEIRKITSQSGTALIFDEVITGFRAHPSGAQGIFDIKADLGTYGKVVAGGLPIGVIAGRKEFMDALDGGFWKFGDNSTPESGVTYFAGTFVRHPLALASSAASLNFMKEKGPRLQEDLNDLTKKLADSMNAVCTQQGIPVYIASFGSLWKIKFKEEIPYFELIFTGMRNKGIHIWDGFPCFLTTAHTAVDVRTIVEKFEETIKELIAAGFLTASKTTADSNSEKSTELKPPVSGAKLGRDRDGNPAWFVIDPSRPGKYLQVS